MNTPSALLLNTEIKSSTEQALDSPVLRRIGTLREGTGRSTRNLGQKVIQFFICSIFPVALPLWIRNKRSQEYGRTRRSAIERRAVLCVVDILTETTIRGLPDSSR